MKIKFIKPEEIEIKRAEERLQKVFERNLSDLDDSGLKYIDSKVLIGTGEVDTMAIDENLNPVFIEYKKPGKFDKDAIFQLMNYYSWFASDKNHILYLRNYIQKKETRSNQRCWEYNK